LQQYATQMQHRQEENSDLPHKIRKITLLLQRIAYIRISAPGFAPALCGAARRVP
jgi:hypothetical protein